MGKTIGDYVGHIAVEEAESEGLMVCPRCGHAQKYFDQLAIQPCYVPRGRLLPVFKCPECKHLFALVPDDGEME
jgi:uncharacterized C2H2 Zn-finger protein